jgi:hypothetical protein
MAHFVNAAGTRISNAIIDAAIGFPLTLGVYGAAGLTVGPNDSSVAGFKSNGGADKYNVTWYTLTGKKAANVMVEAKQGGSVWDFIQVKVGAPTYVGAQYAYAKSPPKFAGRYTENPNELPTKNTAPPPADCVRLLHANWAELNEVGARVLTAQCMHETGEGKYCFNWNLGNVKCKKDETNIPHHYLRDVWEILGKDGATNMVIASEGLGYIASEAEAKKRGWTHSSGKVVAVFEPPHYVCRFKSYASFEDGSKRWIAHHKTVAAKFPTYLETLNSGDCAATANLLKRASYYTGDEGAYAKSMTSMKAKIDRQLGPVRS